MTKDKWPADEPACYGVCCSVHKTCQRYAAVDFNSNPAQVFTDHCGPDYPLYRDARRAAPSAENAAEAGNA